MPYFASLLLFLLPSVARAQEGGLLVNPLNAGSIPELIAVVLDAVIELGSIAIVLALVWVGFLFVRAQGSDTELKKARTALFNTIVGGLILLGASAISMVLASTIESL